MPGDKRETDPTAISTAITPMWLKQMPLRLALRVAALTALALLGYPKFATSLVGLLLLAAAFCVCVAELRRESLFVGEFTHWDEAAVYGIMIGLVTLLS